MYRLANREVMRNATGVRLGCLARQEARPSQRGPQLHLCHRNRFLELHRRVLRQPVFSWIILRILRKARKPETANGTSFFVNGAWGLQSRDLRAKRARRKGKNMRAVLAIFEADPTAALTKQEIADRTSQPFSSVQAILDKGDNGLFQEGGLWKRKKQNSQ